MNAILKQLHCSNTLKKTEHQNFYLEMQGNVSIHYRNMEIQLSLKEFEALAKTFTLQSAELKKIIEKQTSAPSTLAEENVKIWTQSQLPPEPECTPRQISLEECSDGFHLNYRNIMLTLGHDEIYALKRALKTTDANVPYASSFEELVKLLDINKIKYELAGQVGPKVQGNASHRVVINESYAPKMRKIMTGIGMEGKLYRNTQIYSTETFAVELVLTNDA